MKTKICPKCRQRKKVEKFGINKSLKDGRCCWCKKCQSQHGRQYYIRNRKPINVKNRLWKIRNRKRYRMQQKQYNRKKAPYYNPIRKKYYQTHKKHLLEQNQKYYNRNKTRILKRIRLYRKQNYKYLYEANKIWIANHPQKIIQYRRNYFKTHPLKTKQHNHRRRARKLHASGCFTQSDIQKLDTQQNNRCYYCGTFLCDRGTIDHKIPLVRGGTNWPSNLCLACKSCNSQKHTKTDIEFLTALYYYQNRQHNEFCVKIET